MPQSSEPTPADRRLYGALVDDVYFLRSRGKLVARFKGDYRVGRDVVDAAGLRRLALELRAGRVEPKHAPVPPPAPPTPAPTVTDLPPTPTTGAPTCAKCGGPRSKWSTGLCRACYQRLTPAAPRIVTPPKPVPPANCRCGRPRTHNGRCWVRRGWDGPPPSTPAPADLTSRIASLEASLAEIRAHLGMEPGR